MKLVKVDDNDNVTCLFFAAVVFFAAGPRCVHELEHTLLFLGVASHSVWNSAHIGRRGCFMFG